MASNKITWGKIAAGPLKGKTVFARSSLLTSLTIPTQKPPVTTQATQAAAAVQDPVPSSAWVPVQSPVALGRVALPVAQATLDNPTFLRLAQPAINELDRIYQQELREFQQKGQNQVHAHWLIFKAVEAGGTRGDSVMADIAHAQGFDGKPTVLPKAEFDAYVKANKGAIRIVRGFSENGTDYKDAFQSGEFYTAGGNGRQWGAGVYTAQDSRAGRSTAKAFSVVSGYSKSGTFMRMALKPGAKIIDSAQLDSERAQWLTQAKAHVAGLASAPERQKVQHLIDVIDYDQGYFASMMGYDAMRTGKGSYNGHENFIVYNRSALVVQQEYET